MKTKRPRNQAAQALQSKLFSNQVVPSKKQKLLRKARRIQIIIDF